MGRAQRQGMWAAGYQLCSHPVPEGWVLEGSGTHSAIKIPTPLMTAFHRVLGTEPRHACVCVISQPGLRPAPQSPISDGLHLTSTDVPKHL